MEDFSASSGEAEIIASGCLTTFRGAPLKIVLDHPKRGFNLVFRFEEDSESKEHSVRANITTPDTLEIALYNFKNPLGTGTGEPIEIARSPVGTLHLHYRVYDIGGKDKTIQFSVYRTSEVKGHG